MEKIYVGLAKTFVTQYGEMTKLSLSKDDVNKITKHMKDNNLDWINIDVKEKKEKVQGKATHYLEVDQWKPEKQETPPPLEESDDNLPF